MGAGTYDYYSDTKSHGSYYATARACLAHYIKNETPASIDLQVIAACQYSSANATGYGIQVDSGYIDSGGSYHYDGAQGVLNYGNWVAWNDDTYTISKTHATQTVAVFVNAYGATVQGHSGAPENPHGQYNVTIPAKDSYTVSFDANGGSGAPASQTKWYGEDLTLDNAIPTRTNYRFVGWATVDTATTAQYQAGSTYSANASVSLYAVWELAALPPSASIAAYRVATSSSTSEDPVGGYGYATVSWSVDATLDAGNTLQSITATISADGGAASPISPTSAQSGTSGTAAFRWTAATGSSYVLTVTATDSNGATVTKSATVASIQYPIYVHDRNKVKIHDLTLDNPLPIASGGTGGYPLIYVGEATSGTVTVTANEDGFFSVTLTAPTGYKLAMVGNVRSNGAVLPAYCSTALADYLGQSSYTCSFWYFNKGGGSVNATFEITYFAVRDGFLTDDGITIL